MFLSDKIFHNSSCFFGDYQDSTISSSSPTGVDNFFKYFFERTQYKDNFKKEFEKIDDEEENSSL
jgi:hypothetical protein